VSCAICDLDKEEKAYNFRHHLIALREQAKVLHQPVPASGTYAHASCVIALRDKFNKKLRKR